MYSIETYKRNIALTFKQRNYIFDTAGNKIRRKDLIQRRREYIRDCIEQVRKLEAS